MRMIAPPLSLLCELTYRCNLQCPYCYNPLDLPAYRNELTTADWKRVIAQAGELGVVQLGFSGGEPTLRRDLAELVADASKAGIYTNLITQGTFLDEARIAELENAGLDHVQISLQAAERDAADAIAGTTVHERKLEAIGRLQSSRMALTLNCVLHRNNHDQLPDIIALAESFGVRKLELANVQFYGWAFKNRAGLMPTREQVAEGERIVRAAQERLSGTLDITYVLPDYFMERPKPCMHGWGNAFMTVTPDGRVLPCPGAAAIKTLSFDDVHSGSLGEIWHSSDAFNAYRGTAWMPDPCRSCDRRERDFGGCRCQAYLLTGNAGATDPACALSPDHALIENLREERHPTLVPRRMVEPSTV
ncbi:MAG: pyrroloquinoline quinone biosynthesis protein PqqE [Candidatus Velthaea sp.]